MQEDQKSYHELSHESLKFASLCEQCFCSAAMEGGGVMCQQCTHCSFQGTPAGVWARVLRRGLKHHSNPHLYRSQSCLHSFICFAPNCPLLYKPACNCGNDNWSPTGSAAPRAQARAKHFHSPLCFKNGIFWPNFQRLLVILITALIYQRTNALQFPKNRMV